MTALFILHHGFQTPLQKCVAYYIWGKGSILEVALIIIKDAGAHFGVDISVDCNGNNPVLSHRVAHFLV